MSDVSALIEERGREYGDFAETAQRVKQILMGIRGAGDGFSDVEVYALSMIAVKLARIGQSPGHLDSWRDIEAYARLVVTELERER